MATKVTDNDIRALKLRFGIVGESPALIAAIRRAMLVAPIDLSVLIIGESGSGKESFPKIIHESSPRKHKKYIAVTAAPSPRAPSTVSSLATSRARLQEPSPTTRATSRKPTAASSSWTRSPRCP